MQAAVAGTAVREAEIHRETGETKIDVKLTLDGKGGSSGTTTVPFLDRQLAELAATSGMSMHVDCIGALDCPRGRSLRHWVVAGSDAASQYRP